MPPARPFAHGDSVAGGRERSGDRGGVACGRYRDHRRNDGFRVVPAAGQVAAACLAVVCVMAAAPVVGDAEAGHP